jgi:hypothetical protein
MDGISWTDLGPHERRAFAMLVAGVSSELCDPIALRALTRIGLVRGSRLTSRGDRLRKAAILHELAMNGISNHPRRRLLRIRRKKPKPTPYFAHSTRTP